MADASRSFCPRGVLLAQIVFPGRFCFKHHAVADKHSFLLAIMVTMVCVHAGKAAYLLAVPGLPESFRVPYREYRSTFTWVLQYHNRSIGVLFRENN